MRKKRLPLDEPPTWAIIEREGKKICTRCNKEMYEPCGGRALILTPEDKAIPCPNIYAQQLKQHLGDEIAIVKHVRSSPLFDPDKGVDRSNDFLHIRTSSWESFLPHLKLVLGKKGLLFSFLVLTDERVKSSYLGLEKEDDEALRTGLSSLIDWPDLVIIRLGFLGYKNKAAPGALLEALRRREYLDAAVWVIEESAYPFLLSHSFSPEVEMYFRNTLFEVTLDWHEVASPSNLREAPGIGIDSSMTSTPRRTSRPTSVKTSANTSLLDDLSVGPSKKKKWS